MILATSLRDFRRCFFPGIKKRPTISVSYFRRVFGGTAPDLDIGSNRQSALLLLSTDILKFHIDTNALFNEQIQDARHRAQFGQTLSIAHALHASSGWAVNFGTLPSHFRMAMPQVSCLDQLTRRVQTWFLTSASIAVLPRQAHGGKFLWDLLICCRRSCLARR